MSPFVSPSPFVTVDLQPPHAAPSAAATNLAANTFSAVSDPSYRRVVDLRAAQVKVRITGRIGAALVAQTQIRVQYHTAGNVAVASNDAGWQTLADSGGSHTLNALFYTAEIAIPAGAPINHCVIRAGLFSGNGNADPTMTACVLSFYDTWNAQL